MGRHVLELGVESGPRVGRILERCFEAQLDGAFTSLEGGLAFLRAHVEDERQEDAPTA